MPKRKSAPISVRLEMDVGTFDFIDEAELWATLKLNTSDYALYRDVVRTTLQACKRLDLTKAYNGQKVVLTLIDKPKGGE